MDFDCVDSRFLVPGAELLKPGLRLLRHSVGLRTFTQLQYHFGVVQTRELVVSVPFNRVTSLSNKLAHDGSLPKDHGQQVRCVACDALVLHVLRV